jgi:beta-glucosidase/6-phospho-beta-glucosidase/beta-galactosidase
VPFVGLLFRKIKNYPFLNFIKHLMQKIQRGEIGLVISTQSFVPYSSKAEDVAAAQRMMDFWLGWLVKLTYPMNHTCCINFFKRKYGMENLNIN